MRRRDGWIGPSTTTPTNDGTAACMGRMAVVLQIFSTKTLLPPSEKAIDVWSVRFIQKFYINYKKINYY
jgi:hypothetical protein